MAQPEPSRPAPSLAAPARHDAPLGAGRALFRALVENVERVIQGKREAVHLALVCLLASGHLLIEDVPGVGKTSLAKAIARSIGGTWHRVQFTPDLLPSDVTGVSVWNRLTGEFEFRPGGVFANIVLADEINRASPKTQSALLEAMEERQVTVDGVTYPLGAPFMVIATQNPIELEGTYPLPEAQLDRFLMRIEMGYPDRAAEVAILESQTSHLAVEELEPVVSADDVTAVADAIETVHVADPCATTSSISPTRPVVTTTSRSAPARAARSRSNARHGRSPASLGRDYVMPDDVKRVASVVLEHRLLLTPDAELRGLTPADVLGDVLASVAVPGATGLT